MLQIFLKNMSMAWLWGGRDLHVKTSEFFQQECQYLNIKEQSATGYRLRSGLIYVQGTSGK